MSLSDEDLQKYIGQSLNHVRSELENQGDKVHFVRTGSFPTSRVPARAIIVGEEPPKPSKHATIVYNGDDPNLKVTSVTQREY